MNKLLSVVFGAVLVPAVTFSSVSATNAGQIEAGDIYRVKNVTKATDFTDPTTATCGDTVQFKVRIHNIGAYSLENVKVSATLPSAAATSHSSMVTISASNANSKTDTAGVNLDKAGKLSYVNGSTDLLDAHNAKLSTLADGIVGGGVTLPNSVGVSTEQKRFVQFQANVVCEPVVVPKDIQVCELATKTIKTIKENEFDAAKHSMNLNDCKTVVVPGKIQVCELATKKVISINENDFDAAKHSKDLNDCAVVAGVTTPTVIASTGPASTALTMLGLGSLAAAATYYVRSRRNILG